LAAGFQAAYGEYMGTNRLALNGAARAIRLGREPLDPVWIRLAKQVIRQLDLPLDVRLRASDDTEATA
jgi:hypothetical protein